MTTDPCPDCSGTRVHTEPGSNRVDGPCPMCRGGGYVTFGEMVAAGVEDVAFTRALNETRTEYREALDRLSDEPRAEDVETLAALADIICSHGRISALGMATLTDWLAERERAASEKAWDEGHDECCAVFVRHCATAANPYRAEVSRDV